MQIEVCVIINAILMGLAAYVAEFLSALADLWPAWDNLPSALKQVLAFLACAVLGITAGAVGTFWANCPDLPSFTQIVVTVLTVAATFLKTKVSHKVRTR